MKNGLNGKPLLARTTVPGMFTCWACKKDLPHAAFSPSSLRYNGACRKCRKEPNARNWKKYKASPDEFKAKEKK